MSATIRDSIVPLYIDSADRINIGDSTTNYTIALRKSLRNVVELQVSDIVIPRNDTNINSANNDLEGSVILDGSSRPFSVTITPSNYTPTTLAAALQAALNTNLTMLAYPFVWTVTYDPIGNRINASVSYASGETHTWGVTIAYTPLRDVIGLGVAGTTDQTFTALATSTTLIIPSGRAPVLLRTLSYNITSAVLTSAINTSYIISLGKFFNIDSSNDLLVLKSLLTTSAHSTVITPPPDMTPVSMQFGQSISISSSGNVVVVGTVGRGAFTFNRTSSIGTWIQLPSNGSIFDITAPGSVQGSVVAVSGDGTTLAFMGSGGIDVYIFEGSAWVQQAILSSSQSFHLALNVDGSTLAATFLSSQQVWTRTGSVWGSPIILAPTLSQAISISASGNNIIVGQTAGGINVYLNTGGVWALQQAISLGIAQTVTGVAISGNALYFAAVATSSGSTWIYTFGGTWTLQQIIATDAFSCDLDLMGDTLVTGSPSFDGTGCTNVYARTGVVWANTMVNQVGTGVVGDPQQGISVSITSDGTSVVSGGRADNTFTGAFWTFFNNGGTWIQNGPKVVGIDGVLLTDFGSIITISGSGSVMAGSFPTTGSGVVYTWTQNGLDWIQGPAIVPSDAIGVAEFGWSISLNGAGNLLAIGGPDDNTSVGATWIYSSNSGSWVEQIKIIGNAPINNQGNTVALAPDGSFLVIGGTSDALRIMVPQAGTWVEKVNNLGAGLMGGAGLSAIDISGDGQSIAISSGANGAFQFGLVSGVWIQQSPNFNTIYTPMTGASAFGSSISISQNGLTLAIGDPGDNGGDGASFVFSRPSFGSAWIQVAALLGSGSSGTSIQGTSLALINNGTILVVGGPGHSGTGGAIWTFSAPSWTQQSGPITSSFTVFGQAIAGQKNGLIYLVGAPGAPTFYGVVLAFSPNGAQSTVTVDITVPSGAYTIFDLVNLLNTLMDDSISGENGYAVSFDVSDTRTLTITPEIEAPVTLNQLVVDPSSTFNAASWPGTTYSTSQTSDPVDFTINQNVMKKITNHMDNSDNVIVDNTPNIPFRKYPAGFTIATGDPVDIQLRDDHDRIIDLNGANWIMTVYATIRS